MQVKGVNSITMPDDTLEGLRLLARALVVVRMRLYYCRLVDSDELASHEAAYMYLEQQVCICIVRLQLLMLPLCDLYLLLLPRAVN